MTPQTHTGRTPGSEPDALLLHAIGRVAVESSATDEALREILSDIIGTFNSAILFEGQSSDWLFQTVRAAVHEYTPLRKYHPDELAYFTAHLSASGQLRQLRNAVVHGIWEKFKAGQWTVEEVIPRPWGGRVETNDQAFVCTQSRLRQWGTQRLFTVQDVETLADKFRDSTHLLIKAFIRMNDGNEVLARGAFARWSLDDVRNSDAASRVPQLMGTWAGSGR